MDNEIYQQNLIHAVAQGSASAFRELYDETSPRLFAVALHMMRSRDRAEEALQEAFIKIWHNASEYHAERGTVLTWMISIVRYRCLDQLRGNSLRDSRQTSMEDLAGFEPETESIDPQFRHEPVQRCLATLEADEVQLVHLAYFRGMSHSEIEAHTGTPLGTVKSWIRRGLQKLKRCLES